MVFEWKELRFGTGTKENGDVSDRKFELKCIQAPVLGMKKRPNHGTLAFTDKS